ncbi:MAG: hypothetical protein Phog2KO_22470 [Phototrophicaceae bacterium]
MPYPYEKLLGAKAQEFADAIQAELSYSASIDPKSHRDYSVAVQLGDVGKATIYYSPKKQTYKLVTNGLDTAVVSAISSVWDNMSGTSPSAKKTPLSKPKTAYQAFVDGSYHQAKKTVGYGVVILKNEKEVARFFGRVDTYTKSRQIGGELRATMQVVQWCNENNIKAIDIYYDYKGIEMWATGRWKAEKPISQEYRAFMQKSEVKIHWHKVKSHTGVHWNEVADELAKKGTLS